MKKLIREIHRRSLWQVLGIYVAGSWVALQVVDLLKQNFGLPAWFPAFALALLIIGLPVVLATAFVQEGVGAQPPADDAAPRPGPEPSPEAAHQRLFTWRNAIGGGIAATLLWGTVALGWFLSGRGEPAGGVAAAADPAPSIAVLPFASVHTDEESQAFVHGLHNDLLTQLAKIEGLKVISRTSVLPYADGDRTIPAIARELQVATVMEGGVQRSGDRVRLNVQLIDARTDEHLWAETYDQELTAASLFAMQSDLAARIAQELRATLTPETRARIEARPTESLEAFDLAARARHLLEGPRGDSKAGLEEARGLLEGAIEADSGYAQAWALLAQTYLKQRVMAHLPREEALPAARSAVDRALRLDPELAEARALRARLLTDEGRYEEAETELRRALERSPGAAELHAGYARLLFHTGRADEAMREARRAVELDPLSAMHRTRLASLLNLARDWAAALEESRKLIEMEPEEPHGYYHAGFAHAMQGEHAEAVEAFRKGRVLDPSDGYMTAGLAWAYARAGIGDSARAVLREVPEQGAMLKEIAIVHGELGDLDAAFEYLERAVAEDPPLLDQVRSDPTAGAIRADPRWARLLDRFGRK